MAGDGFDRVEGDAGDDVARLGAGGDTFVASFGEGHGNDQVFGEAGRDFLHGGYGHDTLDGGADDDVIDGGYGDDVLTGGAGADAFHFRGDPFKLRPNSGLDIITDFSLAEGDRIFLSEAILEVVVSPREAGGFLDFGDGHGVLLAGVAPAELSDILDYGILDL